MDTKVKQLIEFFAKRRTQRFPHGGAMPKRGPLGYPTTETGRVKAHDPRRISGDRGEGDVSPEEKAALIFAGVGLTGPTRGDVPYNDGPDGGGNVLTSLVGRTALSPD